MVKIRLRRIGTKGRPFYRVVVAPSTAARNGRFVETIGTYDPTVKPTHVQINEERAMHWLMSGAQPSETAARLLNKIGVLPRYLEQRPEKKKDFKFLDKRTASISKQSAVDVPAAKAAEPEVAAAEVPAAETPAEAPVEGQA
jgi:small subunit ribosomal protein S16